MTEMQSKLSKSLHFCTPMRISEVKSDPIYHTLRTGWIPDFVESEKIKVVEVLPDKSTKPIHTAQIISIEPFTLKELEIMGLSDADIEEIERYHRKFHPKHYFFKTYLRRVSN